MICSLMHKLTLKNAEHQIKMMYNNSSQRHLYWWMAVWNRWFGA